MKRCSRCKKLKEESEYSSKSSGYCKVCHQAYRRERYVPVGEESRKRREKDTAWRAKHDRKQCVVCKKTGTDTTFRSLAHKRCSTCMTNSLWWCDVHKVIRKPRCQKCLYQRTKAKKAKEYQEKKAKQKANVFLVKGDGTCGRCGTRIRIHGQIDRGHHCA